MTTTATSAPPTEARVYRVVLLGVWAAGFGADLFEDVSDTWLVAARLLLTMTATSLLVWELSAQARRVAADATARWARSDTAIVAVLGGFAMLLLAAMVLGDPPRHERISGTAFLVLFAALGAAYGRARRHTVTTRAGLGRRTGPG